MRKLRLRAIKCEPKVIPREEALDCQAGVLATVLLRESVSPVPGRRESRLGSGVRVLMARSGCGS